MPTLAVPVLGAVLYRLVPVPGAVLYRLVPVSVVEALLQAMSTLSWNQLPTIPGAQSPDPEVARVATLPMQVPVLYLPFA